MQTKKQNYCQPNNFKSTLWTEVSASCPEGEWCYSTVERRVFYIVFGFTAVLGIIYFSGFSTELASIFKSSRQLAKINEVRMENMQEKIVVTITTVPNAQASN